MILFPGSRPLRWQKSANDSWDAGPGFDKLGDVEVEPGVVDEDDHVGLPLHDILLAHLHVAENRGKMEQHGDESHVGQLAVVLDQCAAYGLHLVAAEEAELGLPILLFQGTHQSGGVQVARCLACYQIVLHRSRYVVSPIFNNVRSCSICS